MIDFNKYFEHIFVLSRCSNFERRKMLDKEFERVGLTNYTYLYQPDSKLLRYDGYGNPYMTEVKVRCNYAHYSCIKMAYELNYDHILILEDDIIFYKNLNKIEELFENFYNNRHNYDIYLFNYANKNDNIITIIDDNTLLYAAAYYLNRHGMEYMIYCLETYPDLFNDQFFRIDFNKYSSVSFYYKLCEYGKEVYITEETNLLPINIDYCPEHVIIQRDILDKVDKDNYI